MSVTKDLVREYYVTEDKPEIYGGTPTWNQYKGSDLPERIGDSDEPTEEPNMQTIGDGREVMASVAQSFSQTIFEDDSDGTIFDLFKTAAEENGNVWLKRVPQQSGKSPEIIGGEMGMTVGMGKVRQNQDGHRAFQVQYTAVGIGPGDTIEDDTSGS